MSTLAITHPTLLDVTRAAGSDGKVQNQIAELLHQTNDILDDMVWIEANEGMKHTGIVRTGIPEPTFTKFYGRTQPSKGQRIQISDNVANLQAYSEIDVNLAKINGNTPVWRMTEDLAHFEGFNQKLARYLFYGAEATEPEAFNGLAPRFNDQSANNGDHILTSAATPDGTDNASIWLVGWGPNSIHGIYPKGTPAGIQMQDKGQVTSETSDGLLEVFRTHYQWGCGLHVKDWRYVVRVQFDSEDLTKNAASGPDLIDMLQEAIDILPDTNSVRPVFYANRRARSFLRRQIANKVAASTLTIEQITRANGAMVKALMIDGIPVRRCDQLTNTETGI